MAESPLLARLAESVADGVPIDWDAVAREANEQEQTVVRQLRVLASVGLLHRTLPAEPHIAPPAARSAAAPAIGRWGHLSLLERLGGGTFGDVYRAWDAQLEREVALKLLRQSERPEADGRDILREARLLARIRHHNVVTVYGVDAHDGHVGLWMELVRGTTLEDLIAVRGALTAREAALIGIELCRALAAIHGAGLLHRDVKAQNVVREDGGRIVLMDLGTGRHMAAAARGASELAGTPMYIAPELFEGARASIASDLYSLGVLLYRLVTGQFPVRATTFDDLCEHHAHARDVKLREARPDLPPAFVRVVERALSIQPRDRHDSAGALEADLAATLDADDAASAAGTPSRAGVFGWTAAALAACVLALLGVAGLRPDSSETTPAPAVGAIRSIAVLPLRNDSGDPSQDYFADGMTDEIISTLGRMEGLNVISRTSSMRFKGTRKPLREIAAALAADAVVEGSVAVSSDRRVRIRARLIRAGTDTQMWQQTFERLGDDVLALEAEIARAIADGIRFRLASRPRQSAIAPAQRHAPAFEAFNLYLRGRYHWNQRTRTDLQQSLTYFEQAIARDPQYAAPHAGLADAYQLLGAYGWMPFQESLSRAAEEAARAIALDDTVAEAHASLGHVRDYRLQWGEAGESFRRALQLNPAYVAAHQWYGLLLSKRGDFRAATAQVERAMALDPLSPVFPTQLASFRFQQGQHDEAIARLQKVIDAHPAYGRAHYLLAQAYARRGMFDRARAEIDRTAALGGGGGADLLALAGCVEAAAGRADEARAIARDLIAAYQGTGEGSPTGIAAIFATLKETDRAFEWLERARADVDPAVGYLRIDPWFEPLRADPRFERIVAALGLTR